MATIRLSLGLGDDAAIKPTEQVLDGRRYLFELSWYPRAEAWMLDLRSSDGTSLLAGIPVRVGQDLLGPHVGDALPGEGHGSLVPVDTSGSGTDPGRDDLGTRVVFDYVEAGSS